MDSATTNHGGRMGMAPGDEPSIAEDRAAPSLKARMAAIRDEAFGIGKQDIEMASADRSKKWTIKGHTFEAVLSEMRPLLAKHGVDVTPNLVERTYTGNRCDVLIDFMFERTDESDQTRTIRWAGAGTDNGDKAFAKAGTNAVKEMLKKRFLVTDRDDAKEETETVDHRSEDAMSRAETDKAKERGRHAIEQWAKTFKFSLEKAATLKDVQRLALENKDQIASDTLQEVTRTFFIDLIEKRKRDLAPTGEGK